MNRLFALPLLMTRPLTRTNFHSSRLTRILADLGAVNATEPGNAFAEHLGQWVDFRDAIALSGLHKANAASPQSSDAEISTAADLTVMTEFTRIRASLERAITNSGSKNAVRAGLELPLPRPDLSTEDPYSYDPYRRYLMAHQRNLESSVRPLRARIRDVVAKASPRLEQLSALDAAFEEILSEREARLLSTVPALLEKRFHQLFKHHQQTIADKQYAVTPDVLMMPDAWLTRFCDELRSVLLAELDFRLQPSVGLLEALHNENTQQQT